MSRVSELLLEVERRFAPTRRGRLGEFPVGELSDGELASEVAANACVCDGGAPAVGEPVVPAEGSSAADAS